MRRKNYKQNPTKRGMEKIESGDSHVFRFKEGIK